MLRRVNVTAVSKAPHFFETSVFVSQMIRSNIPEDLTSKFASLYFNVCSPSGSLWMIAFSRVLNSLCHTKHVPQAITTKIALYFMYLHKVTLCNWHISSQQVAMLVLLIVDNWKYMFLERMLPISVSSWKPPIVANLMKLRTICDVHVTVYHDKFLIIKPTRCTNFSYLFFEWNSTCFGQFLCSLSGVIHCTHSKPLWHIPLLWVTYNEKVLMMDRGTVRYM
jgi:hypothetical protein